MEKKIKAVKLKTNGLIIPTLKFRESDRHWYLNDLQWSEENILSGRLNDLFEIEYEPERKKIILEIESDFNNFDIHWLKTALEGYCHSAKFVFTELPEVFTREDMIEFAYKCRHLVEPPESRIEKFISERKSNGR